MEGIDFTDLISQKEAAELRSVTRSAIHDLVRRGRLQVIEIGGKIFLKRSEVLAFEGQQGKRIENTAAKATEKPKQKKDKKRTS